jgi:hypothetical protein
MGGVRNNNRADAPPTRDQRVQIGQSRGNASDSGVKASNVERYHADNAARLEA